MRHANSHLFYHFANTLVFSAITNSDIPFVDKEDITCIGVIRGAVWLPYVLMAMCCMDLAGEHDCCTSC